MCAGPPPAMVAFEPRTLGVAEERFANWQLLHPVGSILQNLHQILWSYPLPQDVNRAVWALLPIGHDSLAGQIVSIGGIPRAFQVTSYLVNSHTY